jgi:hypothetical protein
MIGTPETREVVRLVERIRRVLAGKRPEIQGAVLADLLAIWLAGYMVEGDEDATRGLRSEMLAMHLRQVRQLTAVNAKILGTTP